MTTNINTNSQIDVRSLSEEEIEHVSGGRIKIYSMFSHKGMSIWVPLAATAVFAIGDAISSGWKTFKSWF